MKFFVLVTLWAYSGLDLTSARPTGAPTSVCVSMIPRHFNRASGGPRNTVDTVGHGRTYVPGVPLRVRISGSIYQGVLLQARKTDGSTTPQGTWTSVPSGLKTLSCSSSSDSVTHADTRSKREPVFEWTPPTGNVGELKFVATVAISQYEWYTGIESPPLTADECAARPCMNGGTCRNTGTSFSCTCSSQWMGDRCQTSRSSTPIPPPSSGGQNCPLDLVFVLDTSDGAMNAQALQPLRNFMSNVAGKLSANSNVGVVAYGSSAENLMSWSNPQDANVRSNLRNINLRRLSATNTNLGLNKARDDFFAAGKDGPNPNMVILISEGPRAGGKLSSYQRACQDLKNMNVRVMVIGVLIGGIEIVSFSELNCHYDQSYMTSVRDYSRLSDMESRFENIVNGMCGGSNPCSQNPCQNGGSCTPSGSSYRCVCLNGWSGQTCTQSVDPCSSNPCRNGGTCSRNGNGYQCFCRTGWTGTICQQQSQVDSCSSNPCRNQGVCTRDGSGYRCACPSTWVGRDCEVRQDPCNPNPCVNGQCRTSGSTYVCNCFTGWSGNRCDMSTQGPLPCSSNPCQNRGTCSSPSSNFYSCNCYSGYSGNNCQFGSGTGNQCSPNPCMNGGTCRLSGSSYTCACTTRYTGDRCDRMVQQTDNDVNEVFLSRFESTDKFGEMRNENGGKDQLDWQTTNGKKKPQMGPMKDASEDNSRGNYAYIMYDRNTDFMGKTARYMTQPIQQTGAMCVEFKYWMTGGWDKLRVLVQRTNGQVIGVGEFKGTSDLHMWVRGHVNIEESNPGSMVIFEAHPYLDYSQGTNMIALDDINVMDGGYCQLKPKVEGYYYRIVGGATPFEGRVEVSRWNTTDPNMWGGLCMNGFGTLEAQLLCGKLFPGSEQVLGFRPGRTISLAEYGNPTKMVQDNINCMDKNSIDQCMTSGWMETSCMLSESAKVRCDQPEFYYVGNELRLADYVLDERAKTFSGRVELYYNGEWGTVCSNGFEQVDAQAVCNTIGFSGTARANLNGANGQGTGRVFLENVNCPRDAVEFTQCLQGQTWSSSCRHSQDVGVTCTFETKNLPMNCDFENNNNCAFFPYSMNNFQWQIGRPPVGSPRGASSMYAKLSPDNPSMVMSVDSMYDYSGWITPMFEAFPTTDFVCVRFWYNAYDVRDVQASESVFTVYMKMGRNSYPKFWLDSRDIGVNRQWTEAHFTIYDANSPFKLKFVAKKLVPGGRQSYIMVDDIQVTEGSCTGEGYIMGAQNTGTGTGTGTGQGTGTMTPTMAPPTSSGSCNSVMVNMQETFRCGFDSDLCANRLSMQGNDGEFRDWTRAAGSGTPSSGTGPRTGNGSPGFIHLEASNIGAGNTAVARVNDMLQNNMDYCLSFDYHMQGTHIDKLRIGLSNRQNYRDVPGNERNSMALYELSGIKGDQWNLEQMDIKTRSVGSGYLYLLAVRGSGYQGDISLDNVKLRQGACCPNVCARDLQGSQSQNIYSCTFQGQFEGCCFRNCPDSAPMDDRHQVYRSTCGASSPFNYEQWIRVQGGTSYTGGTYPGNSQTYYLAVTESRNARLYTGMIDLQGGAVCLKMRTYFAMSSAELRVGILNSNPILTVQRPSTNRWTDQSVTIQGGNMVQIVIDGKSGVFIDDINLSNGRC